MCISEPRAENYFNTPSLLPHIPSTREEQKISIGYKNACIKKEPGTVQNSSHKTIGQSSWRNKGAIHAQQLLPERPCQHV